MNVSTRVLSTALIFFLSGCLGKGLDMASENGGPQKPQVPSIPGMLIGFNADHLSHLPHDTFLDPNTHHIPIPYGLAAQRGVRLRITVPTPGFSPTSGVIFHEEQMPGMQWPMTVLEARGSAELFLDGSDNGFANALGGTFDTLDFYFIGGIRMENYSWGASESRPFFLIQDNNTANKRFILEGFASTAGPNMGHQRASLGIFGNNLTSNPQKSTDTFVYNFGLQGIVCSSPNITYNAFYNFLDIFEDSWNEESHQNMFISDNVGSCTATHTQFSNTGKLAVGAITTPLQGRTQLMELFVFDHKLTQSEEVQLRMYFSARYSGAGSGH